MPLLASELFQSVGYELNDLEPGNEHIRWTLTELADYLTGGIAQMAALKPTLFTLFTPISLGPGAVQSVPGAYTELIDVLYNLNSDGTQGEPITLGSFTAARALGRSSCAATNTGDYEVRSVTIHPNNDTYFYVDPPVPNVSPFPAVWALLRLAPQVITAPTDAVVMANTTPETYREALKDWMLYRAFAKDTESSESFQKSQAHYKAFMAFLGVPPRDKDAVPVATVAKGTSDATASV
jgi:hypothetical protein